MRGAPRATAGGCLPSGGAGGATPQRPPHVDIIVTELGRVCCAVVKPEFFLQVMFAIILPMLPPAAPRLPRVFKGTAVMI